MVLAKVSIMKNESYSIVSWNVRGLGDNDKCANVFSEINQLRPSIALFQETKLLKPDTIKIRSILPRFLDSNNHLDAISSAGGILSATNSRCFTLLSCDHRRFSSTLTLSCLASQHAVYITNVYAPSQRDLKRDFLDELKQTEPPPQSPWLLIGHFNLIRFPNEKNNNNFRRSEADAFNDTIDQLALIELPLLDRQFTWSNKRPSPTLVRLDRVLINLPWDALFPNTHLTSLTRFASDHVPLLVTMSTSIPSSRLFRFQCYWTSLQACKTIVQTTWLPIDQNHNGPVLDPATSLAQNLKKTRPALKSWAKTLRPIYQREQIANLQFWPLTLTRNLPPSPFWN